MLRIQESNLQSIVKYAINEAKTFLRTGRRDGSFMQKSYKLLVADPDDQHLQTIGDFLTKNGFSVMKVQKGKQAFQFALKIDPDLCLLDSQLEDVNGFAVCRSIRKRRPDLPVIVMSAVYRGSDNLKKAKEKFLANDLIERPCSHSEMLERIQGVLQAQPDRPEQEKSVGSLEEKLEQTLSGLELTGMTPKKKKKQPSSAATIQVNTEELRKELTKMRTGKNAAPAVREKPQFKVGSSAQSGPGNEASKLSSKDIFGDLISDIERGAKKSKPKKEEVIEVSYPPPVDTPPPPPSQPTPDPFLGEDAEEIDALPGFGAPEPQAKSATESKANDYELIEKIAAGGMAEVWKARLKGEKGFEKIVAIKKILPHLADNDEFITMFIDEAKVAANLTHPNIAQIYELGKFGDTFFIAMEHVSGQNLRHVLNYCKAMDVKIPPSIVAFIGVKLCNALDYAHKKRDHSKNQPLSIVHRDISPQNILLSTDGEIKLVDFGIAKATIKAANTVAGSLKGKLLYMSPEQAEGKPIDHRSDIFSLGNVLYECLTGNRLVDGDSELSILKKVREADFVPPRQINAAIPARLEHILLRALQKDATNRFPTARDLEKELKTFMKLEKMHITESDVAEFTQYVDKKEVAKINKFDQTHSQIQKDVILPSHSEVKKFNQEALQEFGSKSSSKKWLLVALGVPVLIAAIYFLAQFLMPMFSSSEQPPQQADVPITTPVQGLDQPGDQVDLDTPETETVTVEEGGSNLPVEDASSAEGNQANTDDMPPKPEEDAEVIQTAGPGETSPGVDAVDQPVDAANASSEDATGGDQASLKPADSTVNPETGDASSIEPAKDGELKPTGDPEFDKMIEQMNALKKAQAEKQRKLKEYRRANQLPNKKNESKEKEKDSKKEGGTNGS